MDFRRLPFQFSSTDPAKRQAELQKRFGLPISKKDKMYIESTNLDIMGLQGRKANLPDYSSQLPPCDPECVDKPILKDVQQNGNSKVPHVRVVPIEIEGKTVPGFKRQKNLSDTATEVGKNLWTDGFVFGKKPPVQLSTQKNCTLPPKTGPKVCNVPIQIEGNLGSFKKLSTGKSEIINKFKPHSDLLKQTVQMCDSNADIPKKEKPFPNNLGFNQIETVLKKLSEYETQVQKFSGTVKEKNYKYLDEMLTRLMVDLDNIDTMGDEVIRQSRKAAIKSVQGCIDLLESKVLVDVDSKTLVQDKVGEQEADVKMVLTTINDVPLEILPAKFETQTVESATSYKDLSNSVVDSSVDTNIPSVNLDILDQSVIQPEMNVIMETAEMDITLSPSADQSEEVAISIPQKNISAEDVEMCCNNEVNNSTEVVVQDELHSISKLVMSEVNNASRVCEIEMDHKFKGLNSICDACTEKEECEQSSELYSCDANSLKDEKVLSQETVSDDAVHLDNCETNLTITNSILSNCVKDSSD